ncbi:hypothetical protein ACIO3O_28585 [Streptomyces sp. NPDC087440]|uniref:hypothetical protein n=1 Tax=Streptomyces sp. NPDC087440 TaxID=3365790 RepID=UPI003803FB83
MSVKESSPTSPPDTEAEPLTYCGCCIGRQQIWCPDCYGFYGCATCSGTYKVDCPMCAGGTLDPICW